MAKEAGSAAVALAARRGGCKMANDAHVHALESAKALAARLFSRPANRGMIHMASVRF